MQETFGQSQYTKVFPSSIEPVVLKGARLTLEPLQQAHFEELYRLLNPQIWRWYTVQIQNEEDLSVFLYELLKKQVEGKSLCFAIRNNQSGELIGSSSFLNIDKGNRRVEIGATWFAVPWQRTYANTESKFLMLSHAFERLSCICVQFQTDTLNEKSRKALERLGAQCDGILRSHRICKDGRIRNSVFYSITEADWPDVHQRLSQFVAK